MARTVNAEVIASTFDEPAERHVKIAGIVLEKAKTHGGMRTRCCHLPRLHHPPGTCYNTVSPGFRQKCFPVVWMPTHCISPKRFFGAARNIEGGGSLTILATALIDTGSKMDEVIFEEFKGTG